MTLSCSSIPVAADEPLILAQSKNGPLIQTFADPTHPKSLCSLSPNASNVKFISRTQVGYAINDLGVTEFWRMSLTDGRQVSVAKVKGDVVDFAWAPDGSNLAYLLRTESPIEGHRFWLKVGANAPRALTPVIPLYGREYISTDEMLVQFSHDGKYLVTVDTVVTPRYFQVRSMPDGKVIFSPPDPSTGTLTMAVWLHLGDRLYYQGAGIQVWDASTRVVKPVASLSWYSPSVSPDDRYVAYSDGTHLQLRALFSSSVRVLTGMRENAVMLSDDAMIEQHYSINTGFGGGYTPGRYYVLNLTTNVETPLSVSFNCPLLADGRCTENRPLEVWPH